MSYKALVADGSITTRKSICSKAVSRPLTIVWRRRMKLPWKRTCQYLIGIFSVTNRHSRVVALHTDKCGEQKIHFNSNMQYGYIRLIIQTLAGGFATFSVIARWIYKNGAHSKFGVLLRNYTPSVEQLYDKTEKGKFAHNRSRQVEKAKSSPNECQVLAVGGAIALLCIVERSCSVFNWIFGTVRLLLKENVAHLLQYRLWIYPLSLSRSEHAVLLHLSSTLQGLLSNHRSSRQTWSHGAFVGFLSGAVRFGILRTKHWNTLPKQKLERLFITVVGGWSH